MRVTWSYRRGVAVLSACAGLALLWGCAFDIVHVRQVPAALVGTDRPLEGFILVQDTTVPLGTSFPTRLKSGTRWSHVGSTEHGDVFRTKDQIVTVEASNIHEAYLVLSNRVVTGFYLPVEKTFAPARKPVLLPTTQTQP